MITQLLLQTLLDYNPISGIFTRKVRTSNRIKAGDQAGSLDKAGYLCIRVNGKTYKAHRLAWLYVSGNLPTGEITDGEGSDVKITPGVVKALLVFALEHVKEFDEGAWE